MKLWNLLEQRFQKQARIYIFPTRMGGYLIGLIFLMFLLSIGYSNNLLLIFTLFLFGLNLIWLIQTHYHLHAFKLSHISLTNGHADESLVVHVHWKTTPTEQTHIDLMLKGKGSLIVTQHQFHHSHSEGFIKLDQRGKYHWKRLKISTDRPFGLYRAWKYLNIDQELLVYPRRLRDFPEVKSVLFNQMGHETSSKKGPHDVENLAPYQGEEYRRISWKHYARSGELVVKEGLEEAHSEVHFELRPDTYSENELSILASQMLYCHQQGLPFSFKMHDRSFQVGHGEKHLSQCLEVLALC